MNQQKSEFQIVQRSGATVVEVLVTITIIGLLLGILIPAVQSSREGARRVMCSNHLKQIGIATNNYVTMYGVFPRPYLRRDLNGVLFAEIDLKNALDQSVSVLACPSDPLSESSRGNQSYYLNDGATLGAVGNGFVGHRKKGRSGHLRPADFSDGLSNTAAASERLPFDAFVRQDLDIRTLTTAQKRRVYFSTKNRAATVEQFAESCQNERDRLIPSWIATSVYNHIVTPNRANCVNGRYLSETAIPPMSMHPGGVELMLADGSVRFISDSISNEIWCKFGTRNGGEVHSF